MTPTNEAAEPRTAIVLGELSIHESPPEAPGAYKLTVYANTPNATLIGEALAAPSLLQERDQRAEGDVAAYTAWRRDPKRITADQLLQERDQLDSQALALLAACAERNIYSPFDMEYAFQPWAIDVDRLAEALRLELNRVHKAGEYHELAESVASEYARLSAQPSTEPAQGGTDERA